MINQKVKTPFRYAGGKYYALKHLLPFVMQIEHDEYREPFIGGGSVFFGKPKVTTNWINDVDSELVHLYKTIQDSEKHLSLIQLLEKEVATKNRHSEVKELEPKDDLERAFKYFYLNRTSYSGIMKQPAWGYRDDKSSPPRNWGAMIKSAHGKLDGIKITQGDFLPSIIKPSSHKVLIYLDPPYFEADQKRAYKNHFTPTDHERLASALKKCEHSFLLSYDNIPQALEMYSWANIFELSWNYNTSNLKSTERKKGQELLITNVEITSQQAIEIDCIQSRLL